MTIQQPITYLQGAGVLKVGGAVLTNAQIRTLPNTPVEVLPAPPANKLFFPTLALFRLTWFADYENINEEAILRLLCIEPDATSTLSAFDEETTGEVTNLLAAGGDTLGIMLPQQRISGSPNKAITKLLANLRDQPLSLRMGNSDDDLTGGDPRNTLDVTVYFVVLEL